MKITSGAAEELKSFVGRLTSFYSKNADTPDFGKRRAERAILRRNAGKTLADSRGADLIFFGLSPPKLWDEKEGGWDGHERAFLLATLFCLAGGAKGASLGNEMRLYAKERDRESAVSRRLMVLLDYVEPERLAFHLRQLVKMLVSEGRGLDWFRLAEDLRLWNHPDRIVQRRWADEFMRLPKESPEENNNEE